MTFTFDRESHSYFLDGERLPSVTEILKVLGDEYAGVPAHVLERKRQIGAAVDAAITLDINGELDEDSIHPDWCGYFAGFRKFWRDEWLKPEHVVVLQKPGYCSKRKYAGTPDVNLMLRGRASVVDWKCTFKLMPTVGPQTAGYALMQYGEDGLTIPRYALQLREDGNYRLHELKDRNDFTVFCAALTVYNWRKRHG